MEKRVVSFLVILISTSSFSQLTSTEEDEDQMVDIADIDEFEEYLTSTFSPASSPPTTTQEVKHCKLPGVAINGSSLQNQELFSHITSVVFKVDSGGTTRLCRLECSAGVWKGPLCEGEEYKYGCTINYVSSGVEVYSGHKRLIIDHQQTFQHGAILSYRCQDAKQHLDGSSESTCLDSSWTSRPPVCEDTSTMEEYSEGRSPSIDWSTGSMKYSRGRQGELIIYPGTILHLDCLFDRRRGTPQWSWSHNYRDYPTGWLASAEYRNWKFRISIVYAKEQDSGTFNCTTPRGLQNSIRVVVTSQLCPVLAQQEYHRLSSLDRYIGVIVNVNCPTGFHTLGSPTLTCRDDGSWSDPLPSCVPVTCSPLEISSPHLRVLRLNNSYLGEAEFDCPFGYNLTGDKIIWCNQESKWSAGLPSCQAIECGAPIPPENGQMIGSGILHSEQNRRVGSGILHSRQNRRDTEEGLYYVGSTVQTVCHSGFVLIGEPIIRCTQLGLWSDATPICKRACSYPGTPLQGAVSPLKFIYSVGEKVLVLCDRGFTTLGGNMIECLSSGRWSEELPRCESYL
ncbi:locomotion-related protein Hikaru genki [Eurytemora carolleeae]|uniref:locomotion-related protein Hikaru genki n=1 Tax=Eurytemora carolleeae TaxID=1294199 RepID=UPI000C768F64|nr:locomotion-related protein Hikaru genki [Eurytemora carolleeae]|eukprot:XP_023327213.1 locomotion-related protein Hikaru genki-like [Eurytemora affinis]